MILEYAATIVAGYLLGSVPYGLIVGYLWLGRDIRESGSGKTGTTNVLRTAGKTAAAIVVFMDIAKGVAPALLGRLVFENEGAAAAGAVAAILGHVWPVFAGFRGGRGVATSYGGILGLTPLMAAFFPLLLIVPVGFTRYMSLGSIAGTPIAAAAVVLAAAMGWAPWPAAYYAIFVAVFVEYQHIPNIRRLLAGTEPRMGEGGERPATG
ncbi:MAG: glycerol-3-phosphate 1-O-acyltransferase PlsY [Dehalococcoidia bacterium]|nr:MAG: glycerol-3-phosphate 1-O-acyltransferase [bacterium]MCE7927185.1 glycerol-3-phosphate 1-O-acyltransferase [Chloroflexi bacterium CFX7]MCK6565270.1 glycerol-3-phosphate 1-O-acyltransferase PlsY [Dehalococcoidia bacterium]MCL4230115.1 glycerol-3-phosphate 1-O-acyltransferase PlsY [Dehalococcoidia bacterium]NUQ54701.1 glycerol-3-phosphate 1-O-acyltransferase PlsY [Dehalococcoidia bacterium]